MKKIIKINFIICIILFVITEISSFIYLYSKYPNEYVREQGWYKNFLYRKTLNPTIERLEENLRPIEYRNPNKRPILIFGCSFAYGHGLNEDETFSRKLADYTNRTIINRGRQAEGAAFMYYQLSNRNIVDNIKNRIPPPQKKEQEYKSSPVNNINKDVEYVIYINITGHPIRNFLYRYYYGCDIYRIRYKIKNNKIIENKIIFPFLHIFHTAHIIEKCIENCYHKNPEYVNYVYEKMMTESINLALKEFPNSKFVVILMPDGKSDAIDYDNFRAENYHIWEKISQNFNSNELIIIDIQKYISLRDTKKYWIPNDNHPSAQTWQEIVPILIKELNIN